MDDAFIHRNLLIVNANINSGIEVKSGESLVVECGGGFALHLSQACLGEVKKNKGNEPVFVSVKINDKKIVLGTLSCEKFPHLSFDLIFDQNFELSHNWKHGSVYFSEKPGSETKKPQPETEKAKPDSTGSKQKVKIAEPKKDEKPDNDSDDSTADEDESFDEDDSSDDKVLYDGEDEDSDESDDSSDEDEETPKTIEKGKKRPAESAKKTPLPDKKVKLVTPQKTDGKKASGHVATPHPSKKILKTPASSDQKKEQTQKSFPCTSCNRAFGSEAALQSHSKAKHSAA
ncbi:Histone deacetylase 2a, putative [Ricinus communis]|uniref:Histone deacetylase 2a, putative n=1 Tax=Ricinus communis TaxID=3988 RepID=B9SRG3_RICCO|nr:Histone deacetylase 2a, putative [Ricinus communis]